jgi:hypothetical protein
MDFQHGGIIQSNHRRKPRGLTAQANSDVEAAKYLGVSAAMLRSWRSKRSPSGPPVMRVSVANRRDISALVEHLNAGGANGGRAGSVLASVADVDDLLMHCADEPGAFGALHQVGLCEQERYWSLWHSGNGKSIRPRSLC